MLFGFFSFLIAIPARTAWLYSGEATAVRAADTKEAVSHRRTLFWLAASLSLLFGVLAFNGLIFYVAARSEGERPKVETLELTKI